MFNHLVPFNYWKYKRVHDEDLYINSTEEQKSFSSLFVLCMGIVITILAGGLGFLAGRHLPPLFSQDFLMGFNLPPPLLIKITLDPNAWFSNPAPGGTVTQIWTYNRTFSNPPSKDTDAAWKSIFPREFKARLMVQNIRQSKERKLTARTKGGRGFFSHPSLHVNISGIAVFHELHCLVRKRPRSLRLGILLTSFIVKIEWYLECVLRCTEPDSWRERLPANLNQ